MFKQNEKRIIPVQAIIAQNPFATRSNEAIGKSIAEIQGISKKLRLVALDHLIQLRDEPSRKGLVAAYNTKITLRLCQYCENQIADVVRERAAKREDSKWSPLYENFAASCREIAENASASVQLVNDAVDQYKTTQIRAISPIITRLAGTTTVAGAVYGALSTNAYLQQQYHPLMPKVITVVAVVIALPLCFHEALGTLFKDTKDMLKRRPKEVSYSVYAERRIGQILLGMSDAANDAAATRPTSVKTAMAKKDKKLVR